eukprot:2246493-Prymnesium_polylepis.1
MASITLLVAPPVGRPTAFATSGERKSTDTDIDSKQSTFVRALSRVSDTVLVSRVPMYTAMRGSRGGHARGKPDSRRGVYSMSRL